MQDKQQIKNQRKMKNSLVDSISQFLIKDKTPVSFREFAESPDYLGLSGLYEFWAESFNDIPDEVSEILCDGSLGTGKCVPAGTRVMSEKGYLPIECFSPLPLKEGFNNTVPIGIGQKDGTYELSNLFYFEKEKKIISLHLVNGISIRGTENHKILASDGLMKDMIEWEVGDKVPVLRLPMEYGDDTFTEDQAYQIGTMYRFAVIYGEYGHLSEREGYKYDEFERVWICPDEVIKSLDYRDVMKQSIKIRAAFLRGVVTSKGLKFFTTEAREFLSSLLTSLGILYKVESGKIVLAECSRALAESYGVTEALGRKVKYDSSFYTLLEESVFVEISRISTEVEDVYDFFVPETSRFVAQGVVNHNTTATNAYLLYRLYKLFLNGDPRKALGIMDNSPVYLLYFSVSLKMAEKSGFKQLRNMVSASKWFKENAPRDTSVEQVIRLPYDFEINYASAEGHQIGLNVFGFILDEANFRKGVGEGLVEEYEEVAQLYEQLIDRQISRFQTEKGLNAIALLLSSASFQSSFMEKRKQALQGSPNAKMITAVKYKITPQNYSKEMFEMFVGTSMLSPAIVKNEDHKNSLIAQLKVNGIEDIYSNYFEKVPESLRKSFETNPNLALQNHCGRPTQTMDRFVHNMPMVYAAEKAICKCFPDNKVTISNKDDLQVMDYMLPQYLEFPERPHSLFLDLSVSGDSGGLTAVRFDGLNSKGEKLHTHVFTLEIVPPPPPAETKISKVETFVLALAELMTLVAFGSDQYQSKQTRQNILEKLGLVDSRLSIDSSDEFHLAWLRSIVDGRFNMLNIQTLNKEIEEARHDLKRRRVVKRTNSTDDLFQSMVGAYFLSDTIGSVDYFDPKELYGDRINLVGGQSVRKMLRSCGFKS